MNKLKDLGVKLTSNQSQISRFIFLEELNKAVGISYSIETKRINEAY